MLEINNVVTIGPPRDQEPLRRRPVGANEHYHTKRPHQGIDNRLTVEPPGEPSGAGEIVCEEHLGGLLKHYYRQAA